MDNKVIVFDPTVSDKMSSVRGIGRYLQILKENFPDWVFTANLKSSIYDQGSIFINPFFNFLQKPLTLKKIAKKQIAVIHDLIPLKYPNHFPAGIRGNINIALNKFALRNYDLIITDSESSKKDIINILKIKSEKLRVIYPCLPKAFSIKYPVSSIGNAKYEIPNTKYCLYVGDATWNKNLVNIAKAIKLANVDCVFVGKVFEFSSFSHSWQKELKKFYELSKDDKRFIFAGFVTDSELNKLYEQTSVNLLLSSAEGFGFSYLEAANFSCPSLLSDIPVLKEISDGHALFTNPLNPQDIADKIKEINSDKILRNKIGASAKKRSEYFSPKNFKKEFFVII